MAGTLVNKTVPIDWFIEGTTGYEAVTISNYSATTEPAVQAGSKLEISGDIYEFTLTSITGWSGIANSTQAYIKFVPAGSACTVEFTDSAPTWSDAKQGWYDGNDRYIFAVYKDGSGNYTKKSYLPIKLLRRLYGNTYIDGDVTAEEGLTANANSSVNADLLVTDDLTVQQTLEVTQTSTLTGGIDSGGGGTFLKFKIVEIGDWNMNVSAAGVASVSVAHGLTASTIRSVSVIVRNDAPNTYYPLNSFSNGADPALFAGGVTAITGINVILAIRTGGTFDAAGFDATSYNRGWITIWYTA